MNMIYSPYPDTITIAYRPTRTAQNKVRGERMSGWFSGGKIDATKDKH